MDERKVIGVLLAAGMLLLGLSAETSAVQQETQRVHGVYVLAGGGGIARVRSACVNRALPTYGYVYFGFDIVEDLNLITDPVSHQVQGYYALDAFGAAWPFGSAVGLPPGIPYIGWDICRDLEVVYGDYIPAIQRHMRSPTVHGG